ncbi:MAG TPA: FimV/HubP family polar landmark protein [Anaerolineaceae bacterium]|nr:FimV/HubP family polar landmark protein [Anaerolineaceae bacterium]
MRNLTTTLAVISLMTPAIGYSLGIGDIKLHSVLNQNLDAEIALVVLADEKSSDIKVNLAPPDKFDEAGVPWTSFLSKIKFETKIGTNGSVIIRLSSREAVKEPFLDLLLEVSWPKGSLYREFTMLLDPPSSYKQANVPALTNAKSYNPETAVVPQHQLLQKQQTKARKNRFVPAPIKAVSAKTNIPNNQLTLVAPTEAGVAENLIIAPENEQVTDRKKVVNATSKTNDKEIVNNASPVNDALQDKVAELEKQLAVLQNQFQAKQVVQPEAVQTTTSRPTGTVNSVIQQKPVQPDVKPTIQTESEAKSSLNTYYLWIGGVGVGTLSLLVWLWWRKRKLNERSDILNFFASSGISKATESKSIFSTSIEKGNTQNADEDGKGTFFNELTISDFDAFDTDQSEIDPISEADVYLAYGRYQQAEELMRYVINDQPDRDECKLKLLEIFYSNANNHAFESYANELAKAGKKDDVEFWAKVSEMGSQICQDSTLFSSEVKGFPSKENSIFEKATVSLVDSDDIENSELIDIYENEFTDEQQNNQSIDYDLSTIAPNTEESSKTLGIIVSKAQDVKVNDEFESFDFYFDKPISGLNGEDLGQQGGIEVFDLTDMDESETKLDLAKAYIDMSDTNAAKDMACQVLEKGSAEQKKVAQALLNNLAYLRDFY